MVIEAPATAVITRVHSSFVVFGARAKVFLATWLAGINERPMHLTKWQAIVACFSLCFWGTLAFAGTEARCTGLGSGCICSEAMNSATHGGGNTVWGGGYFNYDDSPSSRQCYPFATDSELESFCQEGWSPILASTQSAFLPPGHTLTYVMRQNGGGICHIMHPRIFEAPDMTYCLRGYSRWDAASNMPGPITAEISPQQKIITIGGGTAGSGEDSKGVNVQISMGPTEDSSGPIHTRFDGNFFEFDTIHGSPGDLGTAPNDCTNNFCRFEVCMDYSAIGEGRARYRMTRVAPGTGAVTRTTPPGPTLHPEGMTFVNSAVGAGFSHFAQDMSVIRYSTHFIVTRVRPENRTFWPGPACEVEGGCGNSGPAPLAPTRLIVR